MKEYVVVDDTLVNKYNQPVPRYTSYPTVPYWNDSIDVNSWKEHVQKKFLESETSGISLYIHLPFCESLCTYCGCNKKITANHHEEEEYILALQKEWKLYKQLMQSRPVIRELHLGGGTPTFFSAKNLERILNILLKESIVHPLHEFSIEGHPNNTTLEQLKVLYEYGFRRISYGVQDNDPEVQRVINRIQPFENLKKATQNARDTGFTSINFDLIYGLPLQTVNSIEKTTNKVTELKPDRIAFYSYAHVPWSSRGQRLFNEHDLPSPVEKMQIYLAGKKLFTQYGYHDIGMDHFALENDDLFKAQQQGRLHRNFMGYTTQKTGLLLGLGVSAISDIGTAYAQNHKALHNYYSEINKSELSVTKGYFLTEEDVEFKQYILDIACRGKTKFKAQHLSLINKYSLQDLEILEDDKLIELTEKGADVTPLGTHFIRNICKAFDLHLLRSQLKQVKPLFSNAI